MTENGQTDLFGGTRMLETPPDLSKQGFHIGTSGYYFDDWIGLFYPKAEKDRLRFYQKYFSFVEINSSFYREPEMRTYIDIESRSRESMVYAVKVNRNISHAKTLDAEAAAGMMKQHIRAVSPLIETGRFYSFLIQLEDHDTRSRKKLDYLLRAAEPAVSEKIDVHIEFRHKSWHNELVLAALRDAGVGVCNTEIPAVPHAFPLKAYATTDKGYLRYSGLNLKHWYPEKKAGSAKERLNQRNMRYDYKYTDEEVKKRAEGQLALAKKTRAVAVAYNNHYRIAAVLNAIFNLKWLKWKLGAG